MKLEINNICKNYKDKVTVKNLNLCLESGVYGLLGANGAGKTTLMRMITTLLKPTSGNITYDGKDVIKMDENYRKLLGYLPQKFGYYPEFSAQDYLLYMASLKGLKPSYAKSKCKELLKAVSLYEVRKKKIKTFSGGMKRRLGIAQALINDPKILILDEPTSGLDPKERIHFRNIISELGKDKIVLLSTHIVSDVESIANNILIMKEGSIIANGTINELLKPIEDSVWTVEIEEKDIKKLERKYIISNMKNENRKILVRIISNNKPEYTALKEEATLEDLFMYYFGKGDELSESFSI